MPIAFTLIDVALSEIKQFRAILFQAIASFYKSQVLYQEFDGMHEDLIECITSLIFEQNNVAKLVINLCKIQTNEEQAIFEKRIAESLNMTLKPADLAVSDFFTLDAGSNIMDFYKKMKSVPGSDNVSLHLAPPKASIREVIDYNDLDEDEEAEASGDIGSTSYKRPRDIAQNNTEITVQIAASKRIGEGTEEMNNSIQNEEPNSPARELEIRDTHVSNTSAYQTAHASTMKLSIAETNNQTRNTE